MTLMRARDAATKATRRRQLLAAAVARLDAAGYAAITMAEVAAAAGLAKGTTYLAFDPEGNALGDIVSVEGD